MTTPKHNDDNSLQKLGSVRMFVAVVSLCVETSVTSKKALTPHRVFFQDPASNARIGERVSL